MQLDIQKMVVSNIEVEGFDILSSLSKGAAKVGTHAFLQNVIAHAEEANNSARSIAGVLVMEVYAEELLQDDDNFTTQKLIDNFKNKVQSFVSKG